MYGNEALQCPGALQQAGYSLRSWLQQVFCGKMKYLHLMAHAVQQIFAIVKR